MRLLLYFAALLFISSQAIAREVFVSPKGGLISYQETNYSTITLQASFDQLLAGDEIILLPGTYDQEYSILKGGTAAAPVVISGIEAESVNINGRKAPAPVGDPCIKVQDSEWITFRNFQISNCWPTGIKVENSRYITFQKLKVEGSRRAIEAIGPTSHHFIIEDNYWVQDVSRTMWKQLSWEELHDGKYLHFNGAFFASKDIAGQVIFRRNLLEDAFNGIRCVSSEASPLKLNVDFEIYDNQFIRIRDNPIEPEGAAGNWWIHHNHIQDAHAWFSFDGVKGERIYIFSNTGLSLDEYGVPEDHSNGKVFKFAEQEINHGSIFVFHNTFFARQALLSGGTYDRMYVWNNIFALKNESRLLATDAAWSADYQFDNNIYTKPSFLQTLQSFNQELQGMVTNPRLKKDLSVLPFSPALNAGRKLSLLDWKNYSALENPDIGAFQNGKRIMGPAFHAQSDTDLRVVRIQSSGKSVRVTFTNELVAGDYPMKVKLLKGNKLRLSCKAKFKELECSDISEVDFLSAQKIALPVGLKAKNGSMVTIWGTVDSRLSLE